MNVKQIGPDQDTEVVLTEKRVLHNAIQYIGERGTGEVPFKVVSEIVSELQAAFLGEAVAPPADGQQDAAE